MIGLFAIQAEAARKNKIKGNLYSIDVSANTITLKDLNAALTTLRIISQLKTKRDEMKASLTDLALGDEVAISQKGAPVLENWKQRVLVRPTNWRRSGGRNTT